MFCVLVDSGTIPNNLAKWEDTSPRLQRGVEEDDDDDDRDLAKSRMCARETSSTGHRIINTEPAD